MPGYPSIAPVQPYCKFDSYILEGRWTGRVSSVGFLWKFVSFSFCYAKIRGCSPLVFKGCPSPLSATPTFLPNPFVSFTDIFPRSGKSPTLWGITLAELSQHDRSRLRRAASFPPLRASKCSTYFIRERWVGCQRRLAAL